MFFRDRVPAPKPILVQMLYRFGQKFRNFQLCQQFRRILFPKHKTSRPELLLVDDIGGGDGVSDFGESREQRFGVYFRIPHGLFLAEYVPLWPALSVPESPEENIPYILLTRVM